PHVGQRGCRLHLQWRQSAGCGRSGVTIRGGAFVAPLSENDMHIRFSVEIDTLTTEQRRGLSMLLTGIEVPNPYRVGPTPGEPEFEFKNEGTIRRSEVSLKAGDVVKTPMFPDEPLEVTVRENPRDQTCAFL